MESASELVYVVDDERRVREALCALLRANGRDVHAFWTHHVKMPLHV